MPTALPKIGKDNIFRGPPKTFSNRSLSEYVINPLRSNGASVVLVDAHTGAQITADKLASDIATIAEQLRARGIGRGSVVGFSSENRLEYPAPLLAALAVGATIAPLNPLYTTGELKHTMGISQPDIVFCSPFTAPKVLEVKPELKNLKTIVVFGDVSSDGDFTALNDLLKKRVPASALKMTPVDVKNDVAAVFCSSGTTGLPKCVELTHTNLVTFGEGLEDPRLTAFQPDDVLLGLIPFFHGYGCGMMLLALARNVKIVVMSMFQEKLYLETIQKYRITAIMAVPPLMVFLAKHPLVDEYDLSSIRTIRCGAAPLSKETLLAVKKRLKVNDIKQGYGMTETSIACCFAPEEKDKIGSSGVITFGMEGKVIDLETGRALPPYKEGEICFRGPYVMKGYKNNKKATDETIDKDGWLHTGDIGYYDLEGFLFIVDRLKELIKYKGFQVAPAELEALLLENAAIKDAAVIGIPNEEAGELPFAYVVKQPDAKITAEEIKQFVAGKVSAQKRLAGGVCFLEEIPKNPSGKILRRELRNLYKTQTIKSKL